MSTVVIVHNFLEEAIKTAYFIIENEVITGKEFFAKVSSHFNLSSDKLYTLARAFLVPGQANHANIAYSSEPLPVKHHQEFSLFSYSEPTTNNIQTIFYHNITFPTGVCLYLDCLIKPCEVRSLIFNFAKDQRPTIHSISFGIQKNGQPVTPMQGTDLFFWPLRLNRANETKEIIISFNEKELKKNKVSFFSDHNKDLLLTLNEKDQVITQLLTQQKVQHASYEEEYKEFLKTEEKLERMEKEIKELSAIIVSLTSKNHKLQREKEKISQRLKIQTKIHKH